MQIVQSLAGYTLGRADLVRRAMSKKKHSVMEKERQNFVYGNPEEGVKGCIANGIPEETANHIYDEMITFASYAFNKSHAAAYAVVSYQTAWLKVYYPAEYMAALMTSVMDNVNKTSEYTVVCRNLGIKLLPPDINEGEYGFRAVKADLASGSASGPDCISDMGMSEDRAKTNKAVSAADASAADKNNSKDAQEHGVIIYGLTAIKGVGRTVVEDIVAERNERGPFKDIEDFVKRMPSSVNRKSIEGFIKAGAFDCFEGNRHQKLILIDDLLAEAAIRKKSDIVGQMTLFDIADEADKQSFKHQLPKVDEYEPDELLAYEKEATGIYLSGHPMDRYMDVCSRIVTAWAKDYQPDEQTGECRFKEGDELISAGTVTECKLKITKTGRQMAFLTIEDIYGQIDVVVFPEVFDRSRELLHTDAKIFVRGKANIGRDETASLLASAIYDIEDVRREVWVAFADIEEFRKQSQRLTELCFETPGAAEVIVYLKKERMKKSLGPDYKIDAAADKLKVFADAFGENNVRVRVTGLR